MEIEQRKCVRTQLPACNRSAAFARRQRLVRLASCDVFQECHHDYEHERCASSFWDFDEQQDHSSLCVASFGPGSGIRDRPRASRRARRDQSVSARKRVGCRRNNGLNSCPQQVSIRLPSNYRAPLDAGRAICLDIWRRRPGASDRGCWARNTCVISSQWSVSPFS